MMKTKCCRVIAGSSIQSFLSVEVPYPVIRLYSVNLVSPFRSASLFQTSHECMQGAGDTTEANTNILSGELFLCGSTTNAYTEKSFYMRSGPFSGVLSHI